MDITLKNVKFTCIRMEYGPDTILISQDIIKNGTWPFDGTQILRIDIARDTAEKWLSENFGAESLDHLSVIDQRT